MRVFSHTPSIEELYYAITSDYFEFKNQLRIYKEQYPHKKIPKINLWEKTVEKYLDYVPHKDIRELMSDLAKFKKWKNRNKSKIREIEFQK